MKFTRTDFRWSDSGGDFQDCRIICKNGPAVTCQRILLAQWSGVFKQLLLSAPENKAECWSCNDTSMVTVLMPDVDRKDMERILLWSSVGEVIVDSTEDVERILGILDMLNVSAKVGVFRKLIRRNMTTEDSGPERLNCPDLPGDCCSTVQEDDFLEDRSSEDEDATDQTSKACAPDTVTVDKLSLPKQTERISVYSCPLCHRHIISDSRKNLQSMKRHLASVHFGDRIMAEHKEAFKHPGSGSWSCPLCYKVLARGSTHIRQRHLGSDHGYALEYLDPSVRAALLAGKYKVTNAPGKRSGGAQKASTWKCPICRKSFANKRQRLLRHLARSHFSRELSTDNSGSVRRSFTGYMDGGNGRLSLYKCELCNALVSRKASFLEHLGIVHGKVLKYLDEDLRRRLEKKEQGAG